MTNATHDLLQFYLLVSTFFYSRDGYTILSARGRTTSARGLPMWKLPRIDYGPETLLLHVVSLTVDCAWYVHINKWTIGSLPGIHFMHFSSLQVKHIQYMSLGVYLHGGLTKWLPPCRPNSGISFYFLLIRVTAYKIRL